MKAAQKLNNLGQSLWLDDINEREKGTINMKFEIHTLQTEVDITRGIS